MFSDLCLRRLLRTDCRCFPKGINFEAIDNEPVKIIILLIVPKDKLTQHIKTLANIAKMMSDVNLREEILSLKTPDAILKTLKNYTLP